MAENAHDVRDLFDRKAQAWRAKYRRGGPLVSRLTAFQDSLASLRPPPARVLELGCGTGDLSCGLATRGYAVSACDFSTRMIEQARAAFGGAPAVTWSVLSTDWSELPFADGAFDAAVASSVLEYVDDVARVISELGRVLVSDGVLLFTVPETTHPVRRLERLASALAKREAIASVAKRIPRVADYARYLAVSKNRFRRSRWIAEGEACNLRAIDLRRPASLAAPMSLLAFRKR